MTNHNIVKNFLKEFVRPLIMIKDQITFAIVKKTLKVRTALIHWQMFALKVPVGMEVIVQYCKIFFDLEEYSQLFVIPN